MKSVSVVERGLTVIIIWSRHKRKASIRLKLCWIEKCRCGFVPVIRYRFIIGRFGKKKLDRLFSVEGGKSLSQ